MTHYCYPHLLKFKLKDEKMKRSKDVKSPRVFISYATENLTQATRLYNDLQRDGVNVVAAFFDFELGNSLPEQINEALNWCDTLMLLWSKDAASSPWVRLEWQVALYLQHRVITLVLDDTPLPSILGFRLHLTFSNYEEDYPKLRKALGVTFCATE